MLSLYSYSWYFKWYNDFSYVFVVISFSFFFSFFTFIYTWYDTLDYIIIFLGCICLIFIFFHLSFKFFNIFLSHQCGYRTRERLICENLVNECYFNIFESLKGPKDSDFFIKDICLDPFLRSLFLYLGIDCNFSEGIGTTVGLFSVKNNNNNLCPFIKFCSLFLCSSSSFN